VIAFFLASIALCAKASKLPAGWREVFNEWDQGISADFSGAGVVRKGKRRFSGFNQSSKKEKITIPPLYPLGVWYKRLAANACVGFAACNL